MPSTEVNNTNPLSKDNTSNDNTSDVTSNWDGGDVSNIDTTQSSDQEKDTENNEKHEIPITNPQEALSFAYGEMGKIMRNDGHEITLKLIGNINYRVGAWIRVFLPSFNEDSMMFISKSQSEASAESEWITSLTLVDYPPSLGKGKSNTTDGSASTGSVDGVEGDVGEESETDETGGDGGTNNLWSALSDIVWKYYPRSTDKVYWVRRLRDANNDWSSIAYIVNIMGGDKNKQKKVIQEVRDVKSKYPRGNKYAGLSLASSTNRTVSRSNIDTHSTSTNYINRFR